MSDDDEVEDFNFERVTFRKNTKTKEWYVTGPAEKIRLGGVEVEKKDGSTDVVHIVRLGKVFVRKGREYRHGFIGDDPILAVMTLLEENEQAMKRLSTRMARIETMLKKVLKRLEKGE